MAKNIKAELDRLRTARFKAEQDQDFAARHGYDTAYERKKAEVKAIDQEIRTRKGLN